MPVEVEDGNYGFSEKTEPDVRVELYKKDNEKKK